jgi:hypothetical protein
LRLYDGGMARDTEIADLKLIVRALHQDVSTLDDRLRQLESEIGALHARLAAGHADLIVMPQRERARGA